MKVPILLPNIFDYPFTYDSEIFLKTGDYVLVDIDNLEDSIDAGLFGTTVKNPISGYQWNNPHPNMMIK